jgi:hypothetical protein
MRAIPIKAVNGRRVSTSLGESETIIKRRAAKSDTIAKQAVILRGVITLNSVNRNILHRKGQLENG